MAHGENYHAEQSTSAIYSTSVVVLTTLFVHLCTPSIAAHLSSLSPRPFSFVPVVAPNRPGAAQEAFKVPLVVQLTDDEKFLFKQDLKLEEVGKIGARMVKGFCCCWLPLSLLLPLQVDDVPPDQPFCSGKRPFPARRIMPAQTSPDWDRLTIVFTMFLLFSWQFLGSSD